MKFSKSRSRLVDEGESLLKYFNEDVLNNVARNTGNLDKQKGVIRDYLSSAHPGLLNLFIDEYDAEIRNFVERIEEMNPDIIEEERRSILGMDIERIRKKRVNLRKSSNVIPALRNIEVRSARTGNILYHKSYHKWDKMEVEALRNRMHLPAKQTSSELSQLTGYQRTSASIYYKRSWIRKSSETSVQKGV